MPMKLSLVLSNRHQQQQQQQTNNSRQAQPQPPPPSNKFANLSLKSLMNAPKTGCKSCGG